MKEDSLSRIKKIELSNRELPRIDEGPPGKIKKGKIIERGLPRMEEDSPRYLEK